MDKDFKMQVEELNRLCHDMISKSNYKEIEEKYKNLHELSTTEISIIRIIGENEDVIIKDIVDKLSIPKSTLTSMIDRLEKRNLIKRAISNRDRRSYKLLLTKEGEDIQVEHDKFEEECYSSILFALDTKDERELLLKLIGKIASKF